MTREEVSKLYPGGKRESLKNFGPDAAGKYRETDRPGYSITRTVAGHKAVVAFCFTQDDRLNEVMLLFVPPTGGTAPLHARDARAVWADVMRGLLAKYGTPTSVEPNRYGDTDAPEYQAQYKDIPTWATQDGTCVTFSSMVIPSKYIQGETEPAHVLLVKYSPCAGQLTDGL
jgi:hypothetical protein